MAVNARLEPLATTDLMVLRESAEISAEDRQLVTEFLNTRRPGWSFPSASTHTKTQ